MIAAFGFRGKPIQTKSTPGASPPRLHAVRIMLARMCRTYPQMVRCIRRSQVEGQNMIVMIMHLLIIWCLQSRKIFWYLLTSFVPSSNWEGNRETTSEIKRECKDCVHFGVSLTACKQTSGKEWERSIEHFWIQRCSLMLVGNLQTLVARIFSGNSLGRSTPDAAMNLWWTTYR